MEFNLATQLLINSQDCPAEGLFCLSSLLDCQLRPDSRFSYSKMILSQTKTNHTYVHRVFLYPNMKSLGVHRVPIDTHESDKPLRLLLTRAARPTSIAMLASSKTPLKTGRAGFSLFEEEKKNFRCFFGKYR